MTVDRISKDGLVTISSVEVDGRNYDLPPWIPEADFVAGLRSGDDDNGLSSLVSCKLAKWSKERDSNADPVYYAPIFDLEWTVPLNATRELVVNLFTPLDLYDEDGLLIEPGDDGVTVKMRGREYMDFNDVQVYVLPRGFETQPLPGNSEWNGSFYEEFVADPAEAIKYLEHRGNEYFTTSSGQEFLYLLLMHED